MQKVCKPSFLGYLARSPNTVRKEARNRHMCDKSNPSFITSQVPKVLNFIVHCWLPTWIHAYLYWWYCILLDFWIFFLDSLDSFGSPHMGKTPLRKPGSDGVHNELTSDSELAYPMEFICPKMLVIKRSPFKPGILWISFMIQALESILIVHSGLDVNEWAKKNNP